jgi:serine/threonine protein kinase
MYEEGAIITLQAGAYRLRERLAGSAYGVLWRADRQGAATQVALKLVNRDQMARADAGQRARWVDSACNEISFLAGLAPWDQRSIVRLLDSGTHADLPAMALELLDGDLGRHVAAERNAGRALPFATVLGWIAQVNQALAKVHQYGWRYLDLKPGNLLLDATTGGVKLADFGTGRLLADPGAHSYAGTANWQAPEQFFPNQDGGYDTDARTDYFALGALLFYLACGGRPLRYCGACGAAYREHGHAGAARLAGAVPPILAADEEALFVRRIDSQAPCAGRPALALLRTLLASRREQRPRHALDISRHIAAIHSAVDGAGALTLRSAA